MYDSRRLEIFYELAQQGSLAAAADVLGYDPSTVSNHLAKLQAEVGHRLYEKSGRGVVLTPRGLELADYAGQILSLMERAHNAMASETSLAPRTLKVASFNSAARYMVPRVFVLLEERAPHLSLELTQLEPQRSIAELARHQFDLVIAEEYEGRPVQLPVTLVRRELWEDPIVLVAPAAMVPPQPLDSLAWAESAPWCMEPPGTELRAWSDAYLADAHIAPRPRFISTDLSWQLHSAYGGYAVALLPHLVLDGLYRSEVPAPSGAEPWRQGVRTGNLWVSEPLGRRRVFAVLRASSEQDAAARLLVDILRDLNPASSL